MKRAILRDKPAGRRYDITSLLEENGEVTIGRSDGNVMIKLGENNTKRLKRDTETGIRVLSDPTIFSKIFGILGRFTRKKEENYIRTVSKIHGVITYEYDGWNGQGFYIKDFDASKNGITKDGYHFKSTTTQLKGKVELFFGLYGPVIFEEIETD